VKLGHMPWDEVQTVANAIDAHPFMRRRKEVRDSVLRGL
jgi:hypothetical protein